MNQIQIKQGDCLELMKEIPDKSIDMILCDLPYQVTGKHWDIAIFTSKGERANYYPQMIKREKPIKSGGNSVQARVYSGFKCMENGQEYKKTYEYKYPITLIEFDKIRRGGLHPTQKPVALLEYLIKTYTNEGDVVLDNCMGSGSTGVACINTNRNFIGYELDEHYFQIAKERLEQHECKTNI